MEDKCEQAINTLRGNDHGGYTVPTSSGYFSFYFDLLFSIFTILFLFLLNFYFFNLGLYPAQWNWDSCLVALGFAQFDPDRAWVEIETFFKR